MEAAPCAAGGGGGGAFERLQVYEQRIERQFHDCLQPLRLLRKMRTEHGNDPFADRSAGLGFEASEPRTNTTRQEVDSDAPTSSSGVPPVPLSLHSFDLSVQTNEERREEKMGETPGLRQTKKEGGADRTGGTPWLLSARAQGEPALVRHDAGDVLDESHFGSSNNPRERTNPIKAEAAPGPTVTGRRASAERPGGTGAM